MNIIINGRHLDITPSIKDYTEGKIKKFQKFLSNIDEANVTLSVEKYRHKAEILIKAGSILIQTESITDEIYNSIDESIEKLERRIKKYKEKIKSHRKENNKRNPLMSDDDVFADENNRIIKRNKFAMKPMNPEEAAMQMELLEKSFFVFTNDASGDINVIYKINDSDLGLIEPMK